MTLTRRAFKPEESATLRVKAHPLAGASLEQFLERRVSRDLRAAKGVLRSDKTPAILGKRRGIVLTVDRTFASGAFRSAIFGFSRGGRVFLVDYTAPLETHDREPEVLRHFVESLRFETGL